MEHINKSLLLAAIQKVQPRTKPGHFFGKADNSRPVLQTNGVDQYGRLAKPITGVGQGTITIVAKVVDLGAPQYLFDGDSASNRLFCYLDTSGNTIRSAGLTATVNGSGSVVAWGSQASIEVAGDFTGLVLATLLRQNGPVFFAQAQPFYFKYEDEAQTLEFNFDSGLGYDLPVGAVVGRDLVTQNATTVWDGTEGDWSSVNLGINGPHKNCWETVFTFSPGSTGWLKIDTDGSEEPTDSPWVLVDGKSEVRVITQTPTGTFATVQNNAGANKFIGTVTVSIREVPNALIWQNNPTWADYVQQPNGDWKGKANLWTYPVGYVNTAAAYALIEGTWASPTITAGEYYTATGSADIISGQVRIRPGDDNIVLTGQVTTTEVLNESGDDLYTSSGGTGFEGTVGPITVNHLIKLSDYQRNQFYIAQAEKAIAGYQAKQNSRWVTKAEGVDDRVDTSPVLLTGDYDIRGIFKYPSLPGGTSPLIGGSGGVNPAAGLFTVYMTSLGKLSAQLPASSGAKYPPSISNVAIQEVHTYHLFKRGDTVTLRLDDNPNTQSSITAADFQPIQIDYINGWSSLRFQGEQWDVSVLDHTAPLPIGQGGNSGYWPLNDPDNTVRNVLGKDAKGNVVAKDGVGLGPEQVLTIPWSQTDQSTISGNVAHLLSDGTYSGVFSDVFSGTFTVSGIATGTGTWSLTNKEGGTLGLDGLGVGEFSYTVTTTNGLGLKRGGACALTLTGISIKPAYGYGTWQGNPSRELYTLDKVDGSLLGPNIATLATKTSGYYPIDNGDGSFKVGDRDPAWQSYLSWVAALETGATYRVGYTPEGPNNSDGLVTVGGWGAQLRASEMGAAAQADITSIGTVLQFRPYDGATTAYVNMRDFYAMKKLSLSPELQRQYDLAQVEAKISKLDKLYSKVVPLLTLDGVDDAGSFPAITFAGDAKFVFPVQANEGSLLTLLSSPALEDFIRLNSSTGDMAIRVNDIELAVNIPGYDRTLFSFIEVERKGTVWTACLLGGVKGSNTTAGWDGAMTFTNAGKLGGIGQFYSGKLGPIPMIDYANPLNSRYLVPTATGFKDMLGDGSTDGTYQGNPALPQTFTKAGDDMYGPAQTIVPNNIGAQWASVGAGMYALTGDGNYSSLQSTDMLVVGKEYEVSLTVEEISGYTLKVQDGPVDLIFPNAPGVYITRFVATTTVLNIARRKPGETINATLSNLTLKQIIKGA